MLSIFFLNIFQIAVLFSDFPDITLFISLIITSLPLLNLVIYDLFLLWAFTYYKHMHIYIHMFIFSLFCKLNYRFLKMLQFIVTFKVILVYIVQNCCLSISVTLPSSHSEGHCPNDGDSKYHSCCHQRSYNLAMETEYGVKWIYCCMENYSKP